MKGYLSLGSNIGNRLLFLRSALIRLEQEGVRILKTSSLYETKPFGTDEPQENYYNLVAAVEFEGTPRDLLRITGGIEDALGRQRPHVHAPRTIDIDILLLEGVSISTPELTIPHPGMEARPFVIYPLSEVEPDVVLPSGRPIIEVKNALPDDEIVGTWILCDE